MTGISVETDQKGSSCERIINSVSPFGDQPVETISGCGLARFSGGVREEGRRGVGPGVGL